MNGDFSRQVHNYQSSGRALIEFFKLLRIAQRAQGFNSPSPADTKVLLQELDPAIVSQSLADINDILIANGINPEKL